MGKGQVTAMASERESWIMDVEMEGHRQRVNRGLVILAVMAGSLPYISTMDLVPWEWRFFMGAGYFLLTGAGAGLLSSRVGVLMAYGLGLIVFPLFQYGLFCYHGDPSPFSHGYYTIIFMAIALLAAVTAFVVRRLVLKSRTAKQSGAGGAE